MKVSEEARDKLFHLKRKMGTRSEIDIDSLEDIFWEAYAAGYVAAMKEARRLISGGQ